jgi:L-seryl-tRNA(Ser) seleniumtransferase
MPKSELQKLPALDALLREISALPLIEQFGRDLTQRALREILDEIRDEIRRGGAAIPPADTIARAGARLAAWLRPTLIPVINASGIILHTNLGRAPLSHETVAAMQTVSGNYSSLEYNLDAGKRGKRSVHAEALLQLLTGAESALVVNNNAGALLLVLTSLAKGREVVIANSQLVEIGGGFRVPDVMRQSGAKLRAIGTTNRVHLADYGQALGDMPALALVAHHSNFKIVGFTAEPDIADIADASHRAGVPLVYDLGSGALLDTAQFGLAHEPTVQEALRAGADIICFSGDKLMGGPQAGIIIGRRDLLDGIKKHPLARALRADKLILSGVATTLAHYLKGEALEKIPVWRMISTPVSEIRERAARWQQQLRTGEVISGVSMIGGGSLPEESMPTALLALSVRRPNRLLERLRRLPMPVIARVEQEKALFDPRTVLPEQDDCLISGLRAAFESEPETG